MCVRESKNSVLRWPHDITVHTLNYLVKVDIFTLQYIVEPVLLNLCMQFNTLSCLQAEQAIQTLCIPPTFPLYITLRYPPWRFTALSRSLIRNSPDQDQDNWVIVDTTRCCAPHLCWWCITRPPDTMGAPTPVLWTISRPWRPSVVIFWSLREHFQEKI